MSLPIRCRVYVSYDGNPTVGAVTTTEITSKVQSVQIRRGRSHELDEFQAGTATIVVDNRGGSFNPSSMNLRIPVWVEAEDGLNTYTRFAGYVQSWDASFPAHGKNATVTIQAADYFAVLARKQLPDTAYEYVVRKLAPTLWFRLDETGPTAVDFVGTNTTLSYAAERQKVDALEAGGAGASYVPPGGSGVTLASGSAASLASSTKATLTAIVNMTSATSSSLSIVKLYNSNDTLDILSLSGSYAGNGTQASPLVNRQPSGGTPVAGRHHLALVRDGANLYLYVDGVLNASTGTFGTNAFTPTGVVIGADPGMTVDEVVIWQGTALGSSDVATLAKAADGFAGQDVSYHLNQVTGITYGSTSSVTLGQWEGTDALSYCQRAVRSDQGRFFGSLTGQATYLSKTDVQAKSVVAVFSDATAGKVPYDGLGSSKDDRLVYNDVTVSGSASVSATVQDATSIDSYGPLSLSWSTLLPSDQTCRDVAGALVSRFKDPQARPKQWTTHPARTLIGSSTGSAATTFPIDLADIVTLERSAVSTSVEVTSIVDEIDLPKGLWRVTFTGAPKQSTTWFTWGTSNWDGSDGWS